MTKGGKREGAGRKPAPGGAKVAISVKLPPALIAWMDGREESRAVLIETAIAGYYSESNSGAKHGTEPARRIAHQWRRHEPDEAIMPR